MQDKEIKHLICVTCPRGCRLEATIKDGAVLQVEGSHCKRGCHYAEAELKDPRRMIASTVRVRNGRYPVVPVTVSAPIQKPLIGALMKALREVELEAPVRMGDVVLSNALGSGVDVLVSRDMPAV